MKNDEPEYRPLNARRRVLLVLLALATAGTVILSVVGRPGGDQRGRDERAAGPPLCSAGRSTDCVGGKVEVIVKPAVPAASRQP